MTFEFVCIYNDGQVIHQRYGTLNETKFGDIDIKKLKTINLRGLSKTFGVDMDGHFNINGTIVRFEDIPEGLDYRPIYFRRVRQAYLNGGIEVTTKYAVGIQATVDGKNIQRILLVDEYGNLEIIKNSQSNG